MNMAASASKFTTPLCHGYGGQTAPERCIFAPEPSGVPINDNRARGWLQAVTVDPGASQAVTNLTYDAMGNRTQTTIISAANTITATQSQTFDELGRLLREIGAAAQTTIHAYDKADNQVTTTDPRGKLYSFAFDPLNRLVSETDPALALIAYTNDPARGIKGTLPLFYFLCPQSMLN
jgi:YD repeat-containing protein